MMNWVLSTPLNSKQVLKCLTFENKTRKSLESVSLCNAFTKNTFYQLSIIKCQY